MAEGKSPPTLEELKQRLREAQRRSERHGGGPGGEAKSAAGVGFGLRVATELVAGLVIGVGIGLALDYWLGTKPWMLVVFFFIGAAAGFLNVYRTMAGQGEVGGQETDRDGHKEDGRDRDGRGR